ncbi:hypothetical protein ACQY0O_002121 [Thecaphora frezii]
MSLSPPASDPLKVEPDSITGPGQAESILSKGEQIRAQIRLSLQQKKTQTPAKAANRRLASPSDDSHDDNSNSSDEDGDDADLRLPAFMASSTSTSTAKPSASPSSSPTRSRRPQRQAAINRPRTYDIDPINHRTRLRKHPASLTSSLASKVPSKRRPSLDRRYSMQVLLEERLKDHQKSGGQERFARADAIALELTREAEAALDRTLAEHRQQDAKRAASLDRQDDAYAGGADADSLYWSSDDTCSTCCGPEDCGESSSGACEAEGEQLKHRSSTVKDETEKSATGSAAPTAAEADRRERESGGDPERQHRVMLDVLMSGVDDEHEGKAILDIVRRDLDSERLDPTRADNGRPQKRKSFWRSCRVPRPQPEDIDAYGGHLTPPDDAQLRRLLLSGTLPFLFRTMPIPLPALCTCLFLHWILSEDLEVRQRSHEAFADIIQRHVSDEEREEIIDAIAARMPRLLVLLGGRASTIRHCFSLDEQDAIQAPSGVRKKVRSVDEKGASSAAPWLTRSRLWTILGRLMQAIRVVSDSSHTPPRRSSAYAEGLFISLVLIRCELHYGSLRDEIGQTLTLLLVEFSPFSVSSNAGAAGIDHARIWDVLAKEDLAGRLRVLSAFPADGYLARTIRRWLAWRSLIGERNVAGQRGLRYTIPELGRLAAVVDHAHPESPFYISPPSEDRKAHSNKTDYGRLCAATELLGMALSDVALQICKPNGFADTPGPGADDSPLKGSESSPGKRKDLATHSRALDLALAPYRFLEARRRGRRVEAMRSIVARLKEVNGEVLDMHDPKLERARAKDALLRLYLSLDYQITMYEARPHKWNEAEAAAAAKVGLSGKVPTALDLQLTQKLGEPSDGRCRSTKHLLVPGSEARPRFTTSPSSSMSTSAAPAAGGETAEKWPAKTSLPQLARPESPSKGRVARRPVAVSATRPLDGELGRRREREASPSKDKASRRPASTPGVPPTATLPNKAEAGAALAAKTSSSGRGASKRTQTRSRSPTKATSKRTKVDDEGGGGGGGGGKQRKLTAFFTERPEVVVLAPRPSSPSSLRGGRVAVDVSDGEQGDARTETRRAALGKATRRRHGDGGGGGHEGPGNPKGSAEEDTSPHTVRQRATRSGVARKQPLEDGGIAAEGERRPPPRRGAEAGAGARSSAAPTKTLG